MSLAVPMIVLGAALVFIGTRYKYASVLSLGITLLITPIVFPMFFAAGWGGVPEDRLKVYAGILSSCIALVSAMIVYPHIFFGSTS